MIDRILKVALHMKKHKSHARHVFSYLEKNYNLDIVFGEDDEKRSSKKSSGGGKDRKSVPSLKGKDQVF
jgi:hypothetical protein